MKLTRAKVDVGVWILSGLLLAAAIWFGLWIEWNLVEDTYSEIVVDGRTYVTGSDANGIVGLITGIVGGGLSIWWLGVGVAWLYDRAS